MRRYCSLGSHMLARLLAPGSISLLLQGILEADCRALLVSSSSDHLLEPSLAASKLVRLEKWLLLA